MSYFGKNLKYLRLKAGDNQTKTASALGFRQNALSLFENEEREPGYDDLIKVSRHFNIPIDDILTIDMENVHLMEKMGIKKNTGGSPSKSPSNSPSNPENEAFLSDVTSTYNAAKSAAWAPKVITVDTAGNENIPLVPVRARAGYLQGYGDPKFIENLAVYRLPGLRNGTFRAFEVEGLSMYNTLSPGDIAIGSFVEEARAVRDDRVYIFVTKEDGILIKRAINRVEQSGKFILKSDNVTDRDMYPNIVLDASKIVEIWYVEAALSKNLRAPSQIYSRLNDLEAKMALLTEGINLQWK